MAFENNLLEFHRQHREEIDILADEKALFVLEFIQKLGTTTLQELTHHLRWDWNELVAICTKLQSASMVEIQDICNPTMGVELLRNGRDLLKKFYKAVDVGSSKPADLSKSIWKLY